MNFFKGIMHFEGGPVSAYLLGYLDTGCGRHRLYFSIHHVIVQLKTQFYVNMLTKLQKLNFYGAYFLSGVSHIIRRLLGSVVK